jgi:hypothetical protein
MGEANKDSVVAMREGIRSANATSGCGSIAIDVNEESVAPWYLQPIGVFPLPYPPFNVGLEDSVVSFVLGTVLGSRRSLAGMNDVTTATGCAMSLKRRRRSSFNFLGLSLSPIFVDVLGLVCPE